jgi:1,4-alpha-glucan branching enzyme
MRKNQSQKAIGNANGPSELSVRLEYTHATAKSVSVAGTFNGWRAGVTQMIPMGNGHWRKDLVLAPGIYEYRLIVDGEWRIDPLAVETVPNPFGGANSVLKIPQTLKVEDAQLPCGPPDRGNKTSVHVPLPGSAPPRA